VFFKYLCKTDYQITSDEDVFINYIGAKVNYSINKELPGIQIYPSGLLFERGIKEQEIAIDVWNGVPVFYTTREDTLIPFDVFAASFYLLVRYEEYLPFIGDNHGRFMAESSIAFQHGFLQYPVVDKWAMKFKTEIIRLYPNYQFEERKFKFLATIDVDSAFAYKNKGLVRMVGGFLKDVIAFNFGNFKNRLLTVLGKNSDPYDTYAMLNKLHADHEIDCIFFFLLADYGVNDKNLPHTSMPFQELIRSVADYNEIGIHPGYQSNFEPEAVEKERKRLSEIAKRPITRSRQHYLMLRFPDTFAHLVENEIIHDYTMGYADYPGFRAGTCSEYPFYNLQNETLTKLIIHPFTVMDATLNKYRNESPEQAIKSIKVLMDEVREVDGTFISLWHNESLSEKWHWKGWRKVYEEMLEMV